MNAQKTRKPYPGLRYFEYSEKDLFFGRESQAEDVGRRLAENHFTAVVGVSGSGKSSLVRAGLLPLALQGKIPGLSSKWRVAVLRPGEAPIRNLAKALVRPLQFASPHARRENEEREIGFTEAVLRCSGVGLREFVEDPENDFDENENLLILVDQFEEIFRSRESGEAKVSDEAAAFVRLLLEATANDKENSRIYVIITMRSDFLGDCAQIRDLPEAINDGQYLIPRLDEMQLRSAISSPAMIFGASLTPELIDRLIHDIGDDQDQLPVLQHALMRTWDERQKRDPQAPLGLEHYKEVGAMDNALSDHAEEILSELERQNPEYRRIAEKMFKTLTYTDRQDRQIRRATKLKLIENITEADRQDLETVINAFRAEGTTLLMPPDESLNDETLVDITHESLIRKWTTLRDWVKQEAKDAWLYNSLSQDASLWQGVRNDVLWRGQRLTEAVEWRRDFDPQPNWTARYQRLTEDEKQSLRELKQNSPDLETKEREEIMRQRYNLAMSFIDASLEREEKELDRERQIQQEKLDFERKRAESKEREAKNALAFAEQQKRVAQAEQEKAQVAQQLAEAAEIQTETERENLAREKRLTSKLRLALVACAALLLIATSIAGLAFSWYFELEQTKKVLAINYKLLEESNFQDNQKKDEIADLLSQTKAQKDEIANSYDEQLKLTEQAKQATVLAEQNAFKAKEAEDVAKQKAEEAEIAKVTAQTEARNADTERNKTKIILDREENTRKAMTLIERGEYAQAISDLNRLSESYDKSNIAATPREKMLGKWWLQYSLGSAYQKDNQVAEASEAFETALRILGETMPQTNSPDIFKSSTQRKANFVRATYTAPAEIDSEVDYSKTATYRRFAQVNLQRALNEDTFDEEPQVYFRRAKQAYEKFFQIYKVPVNKAANANQYLIEAKKEAGDVYFALNELDSAKNQYAPVLKISEERRDFGDYIAMNKKLSEIDLKLAKADSEKAEIHYKNAAEQIKTAIEWIDKESKDAIGWNTEENNRISNLKFGEPELYDALAKVYFQRSNAASQKLAADEKASRETPGNPALDKSYKKLSPDEKTKLTAEQIKYQDLSLSYSSVASGIRQVKTLENSTINSFNLEDYTNLANAYIEIKKCDKVKEVMEMAFQQAQALSLNQNDRLFLFKIASEIGHYYQDDIGDADSAANYYKQFAVIANDDLIVEALSATNDRFDVEFSYLYLGPVATLKQKYPKEVLNIYNGALRITKKRNEQQAGTTNYSLSRICNYSWRAAEILIKLGDLPAAETKLIEAVDYIKNQPLERMPKGNDFSQESYKAVWEAYAQVNLATFYRNNIKDKKHLANELFKSAAKTFEEFPKYSYSHEYGIFSLKNIAEFEKEEGNKEAAAQLFKTAIAKLENIEKDVPSFGAGFYVRVTPTPASAPRKITRLSQFYLDYASMLVSLAEIEGASDAELVKKRDAAVKAAEKYKAELTTESEAKKPICTDGDPELDESKPDADESDT